MSFRIFINDQKLKQILGKWETTILKTEGNHFIFEDKPDL